MSDIKRDPPQVTTKHGKLRSKRKSKPYVPQTADDLALLELFDEVNNTFLFIFNSVIKNLF